VNNLSGASVSNAVTCVYCAAWVSITSTNNHIIQSIAIDIACVGAISTAGDVNGDGLDDLIVSAHQSNHPSHRH
jgi:hypothetical protein